MTVTPSDNDSEVVVIYRQNNPSTPDDKPGDGPGDKPTDDKPNIDDNHQDLPYKPGIDEDEHGEQERQEPQEKQAQKQVRRTQEKSVLGSNVTAIAAKLPQTGAKSENRSAFAAILVGLASLLPPFGFKKKRKN